MPTYYRTVELAEVCFLSEAVEFLALGRVPEKQFLIHPPKDENGRYLFGHDGRFHWEEMPDNFEPFNDYPEDFFDENEFRFCNIEMPERYQETAESYHFGEISDALSASEKPRLSYFSSLQEEVQEEIIVEAHKAALFLSGVSQDLNSFRSANSKFLQRLDSAWAKIYQAIQSNDLKVQAVDLSTWERLADDGKYEKAAKFIDVPNEHFRIGHDYRQNSLEIGELRYVATRVNTTELERLLEPVFRVLGAISVMQFGDTIVSDFEGRRSPRRRGAPEIVSWSEVRDYIRDIEREGRLPEKKEAVIEMAIQFCKEKFGRTVGRSTVQVQLKAFFAELSAKNSAR